jgi:hypothetical protein
MVLLFLLHLYLLCQTVVLLLTAIVSFGSDAAYCLLPFRTVYKEGEVTVLGVRGDFWKECATDLIFQIGFWLAVALSISWLFYVARLFYRPGPTRESFPLKLAGHVYLLIQTLLVATAALVLWDNVPVYCIVPIAVCEMGVKFQVVSSTVVMTSLFWVIYVVGRATWRLRYQTQQHRT